MPKRLTPRAGDESSILVVVTRRLWESPKVARSVGGETVRRLEVGPRRRADVALDRLGSGRFVVAVKSSAPVVAGIGHIGLTSRTASFGAAVSEQVPAADIR